MAIKEKAYHESQNIKNELHLRELMSHLPRFCKQFFIGMEHTTASRTRIAYAYDLGCFFDYLHEYPIIKNQAFSSAFRYSEFCQPWADVNMSEARLFWQETDLQSPLLKVSSKR